MESLPRTLVHDEVSILGGGPPVGLGLAGMPDELGVPPDDELQPSAVSVRRRMPKVGRNDPCPCGSGKKYKKCCGR